MLHKILGQPDTFSVRVGHLSACGREVKEEGVSVLSSWLQSIELEVLAGGAHTGANAYMLRLGERASILLDAGAVDETSAQALVKQVHAVNKASPSHLWISHAHADHASCVPALWQGSPSMRAWATPQTCALLPRIFEEVLPKRQASVRAAALTRLIEPLPMLTPRAVPLELEADDEAKVSWTAYPSGHISGAACLRIDMEAQGKFLRVLYLSDFCTHDQPGLPGASLPLLPPAPDSTLEASARQRFDVVIMEGALARLAELDALDYDAQLQALLDYLSAPCARLVAVSALGEGAQVVTALQEASLGAMVHEGLLPVLEAQGIRPALIGSLSQCRGVLSAGGCVVAAGGQLEPPSPAHQLLEGLAMAQAQGTCLEASRLALLNAVAPGSIAAHKLQAGLARRFSLPNHSPPWALRRTVELLDPRLLVLVHAERKALQGLKAQLRAQGYKGSIKIPRNGDILPLGKMLSI